MYNYNNLDLSNHWMPFTANKDFKQNPRLLIKAEGMYYWDINGKQIIDGASGLFTCAAGHCREEIINKITEQAKTLDYSPHFNMGVPLSFEFSKKVTTLTPEGIDKVFFTNSGSESVDTAMKIVYAYHKANSQATRNIIVSREKAYHGVNMGGTALSGMINNRRNFGLGVAGVVHMRDTQIPQNKYSMGLPEYGGEDLANDLLKFINLYGAENIAACFVEPIAGSIGVIVPPKGYLKKLREICDEHGVLLVFDEVITGFGRTGKAFASQTFDVTPDLITMAKALTNGSVPMGAVATKNYIYDTITNSISTKGINELFHGYTYSAHPLACAAGIATMDIYSNDKLFNKGEQLSDYFQQAMYNLAQESDYITDYRGYGMMAGLDLKILDNTAGKRGIDFYQQVFHKGLHIKTTGDSIIVAPPLISEKSHIDQIVSKLKEQLHTYSD